jgi:hypothetical protein
MRTESSGVEELDTARPVRVIADEKATINSC